MKQFVATFRRTVEDTVKVFVPDDLKVRRDPSGSPCIVQPGEPNVWLTLEVAARMGLVTVERLHD